MFRERDRNLKEATIRLYPETAKTSIATFPANCIVNCLILRYRYEILFRILYCKSYCVRSEFFYIYV